MRTNNQQQGLSSSGVVLLCPEYRTDSVFSSLCLPVGLGYIARSLELAGIHYEVIDLNIDSEQDLVSTLERLRPQYLAVSMMSYGCARTYRLLKTIKGAFPELKILVGGPHVTANKEVVLKDCDAIDICLMGEGEQAVTEIVTGMPWDKVRGAIYRDKAETKVISQRGFVRDLDVLPFPTYKGFKLKEYGSIMQLSSSRGCPNRCIFCGAPMLLGRTWRKRSAPAMVSELVYWYERGYRTFVFNDSNFAIDKVRVHTFCDQVVQHNLSVSLSVEGLRADTVDEDLLKHMRRAGFDEITFGVESGSNKVLRNLKKGETVEEIDLAIRIAVDLGFGVGLFFLIGCPGEEVEDIHRSFRLARKYDVRRLYFFNLTPIPGTEYYDWATSRGFIDKYGGRYPDENFGFSGEAVFATDTMSLAQINKWISKARRMERQIAQKELLERCLQRFFSRRVPLHPIYRNDFFRPLVFCSGCSFIFRQIVSMLRYLRSILRSWKVRKELRMGSTQQ